MVFDTSQFVAQTANLTGLDLLRFIGQHLYLIPFILLFILPFLFEFIMFSIFSERGRIKTSKAIITLVLSNVLRLALMIVILFGVASWYLTR